MTDNTDDTTDYTVETADQTDTPERLTDDPDGDGWVCLECGATLAGKPPHRHHECEDSER